MYIITDTWIHLFAIYVGDITHLINQWFLHRIIGDRHGHGVCA